MKDAFGHGSNGTGNNSALTKSQGPSSAAPHFSPGQKGGGGTKKITIHGGAPMSSNAQAAQSLMSSLKSTQAPIHPAMVGRPSPDGGSAS